MALLIQIKKKLTVRFVVDLSSNGDLNDQIVPIFAMAVLSRPMSASAGFEVLLILKTDQCVEVSSAAKVKVASVAPIPATGASPGDIFLPSKG
jgi:hypothetical protein